MGVTFSQIAEKNIWARKTSTYYCICSIFTPPLYSPQITVIEYNLYKKGSGGPGWFFFEQGLGWNDFCNERDGKDMYKTTQNII